MTTLTITSPNQGFGYNEGAAVRAFAIIEKLVSFAGAVLRASRDIKIGGAVRPARP